MSNGDAHLSGDCWPSQCPACMAEDAREADPSPEVLICDVGTCERPAQPEHTPCCSSSFHSSASYCCEHYCRSHFVEAHPCSPSSHAAGQAASVTTTKD